MSFGGTAETIKCNELIEVGSALSLTVCRIYATLSPKPRRVMNQYIELTCNGFENNNCFGTAFYITKILQIED